MELRQLEYFATVARIGNMTAAARQLHVSQPSLSMTIARLEEDLGVPLFDRIGGKIHLNRAGRDLLQNAEQILRQVHEMYIKAEEQTGHGKSLVLFGVSEAGLVLPLIHAYLDEYPPLILRENVGTREELLHQLESGSLDFAILNNYRPMQNITWLPLLTEETMVIVHKEHPLAAAPDRSVSAETLLNYPFVLNESDLSSEGTFHRLFQNFDREPPIQMVSQEAAITMEAMARGLGVGLISSTFLQTDSGPFLNRSVPLHIKGAKTASELGLATLTGRFMPAAAKQFYEFTKDFFLSLPSLSE